MVVKVRTGPAAGLGRSRSDRKESQMARVVKMWAIGMVFATMATVGMGALGASEAHAGANWTPPPEYGEGCAEMLENPTDANCEEYAVWAFRWDHWDNDRYVLRHERLYDNGFYRKADIMVAAADYGCKETLFEDFSCGTYE
jgi:hypothetical protein